MRKTGGITAAVGFLSTDAAHKPAVQVMEQYAEQFTHDQYAEYIPTVPGVPAWAVWMFAVCFIIICAVLLLDYCVIRRNALGNTCCARARQKRNTSSNAHQKRSTNMLLNKLNRQPQGWDSEV